ncbi:hypothetical protein BsWGS_19373 [Bradybaena similaris]
MNTTQEEEIEALKAIYCRDDELITEKDTEGQLIVVNFDLCPMAGSEVERNGAHGSISIFLAPDYPQMQQPKINIRCQHLPGSVTESIEQKLEEAASTLQGQPMLLDLCYLAQELLEREIQTCSSTVHTADTKDTASQTKIPEFIRERHSQKQKHCNTVSEAPDMLPDCNLKVVNSKLDLECSKIASSRTCQMKDIKSIHKNNSSKDQNFSAVKSDSKIMTALLQLDHMRSKHNYIKLIKKWTVELGLTGRLIFCDRLIFILLQGTSQAVREYIVLNRTTKVDVDSKGKACKERLLTVLCEVPAESHARLSDFCVQELTTVQSLQELFHGCSMQDVYQNYVSNLIHIPGSRTTSSKQHK